MSEVKSKRSKVEGKKEKVEDTKDSTISAQDNSSKPIKAPKTMEDILDKADQQVRLFEYGELVQGTVVAKGKSELLLDVGGKSEGIISGRGIPDDRHTFHDCQVGDKVLAMVTQSENDQGYLVLSLRRAVPARRWREMRQLFEDGGIVEVKVLDYHKGGLLVDAIPYSEEFYLRGFVPLSHLDPSKAPSRSSNIARGSATDLRDQLAPLIGEILKVKVIEIDQGRNRLVFSEKEALQEQYRGVRDQVMKSLKMGDVFPVVITGVMPFGLFARLQNDRGEYIGLDGLIHISEISWDKQSNPLQMYRVGDRVMVSILDTHGTGNKLALSIKAAQDNPWEKAAEMYPINSMVTGQVTKVVDFGAFVNLSSGIDGLIHVSQTTGPLEVGQEVTARVINLDPSSRRLGLSLKNLESGAEDSAVS